MDDKTMTLQALKEIAQAFAKERNWGQFHTPKNLSMALTREASELLEIFQWCGSKESYDRAKNKHEEVQDEVADVLHALLLFCNQTGIDLVTAFNQKMEKNKKKYPAERCKGKSLKYSEYDDLK